MKTRYLHNSTIFSLLIVLIAIACERPTEPDEGEDNTTIPVEYVQLNSNSLILHPGELVCLYYAVYPENATVNSINWSTSDDNVATVYQNGAVSAIAEGSCCITVNCDGKEAECEVTVVRETVPVSSISLDTTSASLNVGETLQLLATVLPEEATDKTITWESSNPDVASVVDGMVSALNPGDATITATAGDVYATCTVSISAPYSFGGMCIESISGGAITIDNPNLLAIEYKIEDKEWKTTTSRRLTFQVKEKERVWFKGYNESYNGTNIKCSKDSYLYGNIMSLIYGDEFESKTKITGERAFLRLFLGNEHLFNHPAFDIELPATTLSPYCYAAMFNGCTNLTRAPKLPARVLTENCYGSMFYGCTALKVFPEMAATEMAEKSCIWMMMQSGIEEAPELPATHLAVSCYEFMFRECLNLKKGPSILPALELANSCYWDMFYGCENLTNAPVLPATTLSNSCYGGMFSGCKSLQEAPELPATTLAFSCYSGMFENCSFEKAPVLPAHNLVQYCYNEMFNGCSNLKHITMLATNAIEIRRGESPVCFRYFSYIVHLYPMIFAIYDCTSPPTVAPMPRRKVTMFAAIMPPTM